MYFYFFIFLDSDASDEQQYLLTAASMVGEAVDDLVSSFTRENASEFDQIGTKQFIIQMISDVNFRLCKIDISNITPL